MGALALLAVACSSSPSSPPTPTPPSPDGGAASTCASSTSCAGPKPGGCARPFLFGCSITCDPGLADCNGDLSDGCEVDFVHDVGNCGVCGARATSCTNGLAGSPPEELFECGYRVEGLAVDATNLYVMSDGVLQSTPKSGGTKTKLAEGEWTYADAGLQLDDGFLYWAWRSTTKTGRVRRVPAVGGAIENVISGVSPGSNVLVHAGVAYVIDTSTDGDSGRVVDSTGRNVIACETTGSLASIGEVLYVSDRLGIHSVNFDGSDPKTLSSARGLVVSNGTTLAILSNGYATYQPGTGFSKLSPLGARVDGAMLGSHDDVVWIQGAALRDDTWFGGKSVLIGIDLKSHHEMVRASITPNAGLANPGQKIGPMAEDESFVYFGTSGSLAKAATISRVAK
ncbi:hypothetical protein BH09MYX1_BH09MYX1_48220 [soil metagenome]